MESVGEVRTDVVCTEERTVLVWCAIPPPDGHVYGFRKRSNGKTLTKNRKCVPAALAQTLFMKLLHKRVFAAGAKTMFMTLQPKHFIGHGSNNICFWCGCGNMFPLRNATNVGQDFTPALQPGSDTLMLSEVPTAVRCCAAMAT